MRIFYVAFRIAYGSMARENQGLPGQMLLVATNTAQPTTATPQQIRAVVASVFPFAERKVEGSSFRAMDAIPTPREAMTKAATVPHPNQAHALAAAKNRKERLIWN